MGDKEWHNGHRAPTQDPGTNNRRRCVGAVQKPTASAMEVANQLAAEKKRVQDLQVAKAHTVSAQKEKERMEQLSFQERERYRWKIGSFRGWVAMQVGGLYREGILLYY